MIDLPALIQDHAFIIYWFILILMGIGVIGAMVPALPGASLILVAVLLWGAIQGLGSVKLALIVAVIVLLLSLGVDLLATVWGAQKAGASRWGQIGAIVGLLLGVLGLLPALPFGGPLLGLFIGPFLGALVGELLFRRDLKRAFKAALGVVISALIGNVVQGVLALAAMVVFIVTTWPFATP